LSGAAVFRAGKGREGVCVHFKSSGNTCLLLGDVYRLVEDDPCGSLVTRRHRGRAVVRHVMLRVRQKFAHPETFNFHGLPCAIHTVDNVNFVYVHTYAYTACVALRLLQTPRYTPLIRTTLLRIAASYRAYRSIIFAYVREHECSLKE